MFGRVIDGIFLLIVLFIVATNGENVSKFISASASGTARLIQVLQGNVAAGSGT